MPRRENDGGIANVFDKPSTVSNEVRAMPRRENDGGRGDLRERRGRKPSARVPHPRPADLLRLQRDETTACELYRRLAGRAEDAADRRTLLRIVADERRHCRVLSDRTGREMVPDSRRVLWYMCLVRLLGTAFVVRRMERCERTAAARYALYADGREFARIVSEELRHGEALTGLAGRIRLCYISSVILGLNDALVEFTGALAGFTLALDEPRLVALTGGITGIAAALSMAASEYLATKSERSPAKRPLRAAACTGVTYLLTVAVLIAPYLIFANPFWALGVMLLAALSIIALFNYYYAVVHCESFRRRFSEMAAISFGIAAVSFGIGYLLRRFTGLSV